MTGGRYKGENERGRYEDLCHLSRKINSAATHFILYKVQLAVVYISAKPRMIVARNVLATRSAGDTNYLHYVR